MEGGLSALLRFFAQHPDTRLFILSSIRNDDLYRVLIVVFTCIRFANIELMPGVRTTVASEDLLRPWVLIIFTLLC